MAESATGKAIIGLPYNYFDPNGNVASLETTTDEVWASLWPFQENHSAQVRKSGVYGQADKHAIVQQQTSLRTGIIHATKQEWLECVKREADSMGIRWNNQRLVSERDVNAYVLSLEKSVENAEILYRLLYSWGIRNPERNKGVVDEFLLGRGFRLLRNTVAASAKSRDPQLDSGGLGILVRNTKNQKTTSLLKSLYEKKGWKIAGRARPNQCKDKTDATYETREYQGNSAFPYQYITRNKKAKKVCRLFMIN